METTDNKEIANRIKALRNQAGYTQEQMAERIGLTYNGYNKMENGYNLPSLKVLMKIADEFNVSLDLIVYGNLERVKADVNNYDKLDTILKLADSKQMKYAKETLDKILDIIE